MAQPTSRKSRLPIAGAGLALVLIAGLSAVLLFKPQSQPVARLALSGQDLTLGNPLAVWIDRLASGCHQKGRLSA